MKTKYFDNSDKLKLWCVSICIFLFLSPFAFCQEKANSSNKPIELPILKVGVVYSLTGPASLWGQYGLAALKLAKDDIEAEGKLKIELIIEDSKTDPKTAVLAYQKLTKVDKVDVVIGDVWDMVTNPLISISEKDKKVLISTVVDKSIPLRSSYFFSTGPKTETINDALKEFFDKNSSLKTLALFSFDSPWGDSYRDAIYSSIKGRDITVVGDFKSNDFLYDFKTEVAKLSAIKPDMVFVGYLTDKVVNEFYNLKLPTTFLTNSNIFYYTKEKLIEEYKVKEMRAPLWIPSKEFIDKYSTKTGNYPYFEAFCHYETLISVAKAFMSSPGDLAEGMRHVKYQGVAGEVDFTKSFSGNWAKASLTEPFVEKR